MTGLQVLSDGVSRWLGSLRGGRSRADAQAPWGEGLVELSLSSRLDAATWNDVSADELVWLNPALTAVRDAGRTSAIAALLLDAIERLAADAASRIGAGGASRGHGAVDLLRRLASIGAISTASLEAMTGHRGGKVRNGPLIGGSTDHEALLACLSVLRLLDRHMSELSAERGPGCPSQDEADIADGFVVSLFARFNAAYLAPALASQHELLTCGTWLGHLLYGRDAWLPPGLAAYLGDALALPRAHCATTCLVHAAALAACDVTRLRSAAKRATTVGNPVLVRARSIGKARSIQLPTWNQSLHRSVRHALEMLELAPTAPPQR